MLNKPTYASQTSNISKPLGIIEGFISRSRLFVDTYLLYTHSAMAKYNIEAWPIGQKIRSTSGEIFSGEIRRSQKNSLFEIRPNPAWFTSLTFSRRFYSSI